MSFIAFICFRAADGVSSGHAYAATANWEKTIPIKAIHTTSER